MITYYDNPDWWWGDNGRGIICTFSNGTTEQGVLAIYDYETDDEGEETAYSHLEMPDRNLDITEVKWEYLKENK